MVYEYIIRLLDWCKINIRIVAKPGVTYFKEGEIWWCSVGLNIGDEEFGKGPAFQRPVLIFKKFTSNSFLGLPLTGRIKEGSWYIPIRLPKQMSSLMLHQARVFDARRLIDKIATMNDYTFTSVKERFVEFYGS